MALFDEQGRLIEAPAGNAFMQQNLPPTQAGVVTQQQIPQNLGGSFANPDAAKLKGLNMAAILARLAEGYDKSIGGTGAIGAAVGDVSQRGIVSGQQKAPTKSALADITPKGTKGVTSRTVVTGANGERTVTEKINDFDQLAGGTQAPANVGQAFGGGTALRPFEQSADLSGVDVDTQFKLAESQQDPITNTITGEDGKQYGLTRSGNMIALGVGTQPKAVTPAPPVRGVTQTEMVDGVPMSFLQDPTKGTRIGESFKAVPPAKAGAGKDPSKDPKVPLALEQARLNLTRGIGPDGKRMTTPQTDAGITAYNQGAKLAKLPTRLKRVIMPPIETGTNIPFPFTAGADDFQETDLVMSLPVDKKGNITNATYGQLKTALVRDKGMDDATADERTALFYAKNDLFGEKAKKQYSKKYTSVAKVYKKKK